ncbi:MAG: hypothetical protein AAB731_02125 [Patescibacteria group bacterium]
MPKHRDTKKVKNRSKPFARLYNLFVPFVKPIVALKFAGEIRHITVKIDRTSLKKIRQEMADLDDQVQEKLESFLTGDPKLILTVKEVAEEVDKETELETSHILASWLGCLYIVGKPTGKLATTQLDDSMWPIGQFQSEKEMMVASLVINYEDMRSIFQAVKRSLPAGKTLPDAAVEYLKLVGIEVIA